MDFKNTNDGTEGSIRLQKGGKQSSDDEYEIERDTLLILLFDTLKNGVKFMFDDSVARLTETKDAVVVTFKKGSQWAFDLVFGCDGLHSAVRKMWSGSEMKYSHSLRIYFSAVHTNAALG